MRNYSLVEDMEIMEKLGVGPYQLFLLKMLYEAEEDRIPVYKSVARMKKMGILDLDALADLIAKDIVEDYNNALKSETFIDYIELTPKALKALSLSSFKARELMKTYPRLLEIQGKKYNLVNVGEAELANSYHKNLEITGYTHEQVMELVKWGKENDCMNVGLKKFADTQYWITLEEIKRSGSSSAIGSISVDMV